MRLTREERKRLGNIKGGKTAHARNPDLAKTAGKKGGDAVVKNHPEMKSSDWGRQLVAARERKRYQVLYPSEAFAKELEENCPPLARVWLRLTVDMSSKCSVCGSQPFEGDCLLRLFIQMRRGDFTWYALAKRNLNLVEKLLADPAALKSVRQEFAQQKTSPT